MDSQPYRDADDVTMDDSITLKGIKQGLLVTIKPDGKWSDLTGRLMTLIDSQGDFFQGAQVTLALGPRDLRGHELSGIQTQLARRGVMLLAVLSDSERTISSTRKLGLQTALDTLIVEEAEPIVPEAPKPPPIDSEEHGTHGVLIKRTLRNGRTVHSDGHAVIIGDVNAGAVVVAHGDVIVWGRLRGTVHAGANGDEAAVVCALYLAPTQLRIAGYITISPEDRRRKPRPEKAMIRNGRIEAVAWE
ncbi:MAG: septum site-determining protein MinC [Anaerolineae bacterium]|nr:septum site-determining protein MinC [Anaerolineae bacterium]